jgi:DNA polymerase III alpha subunit
LSIAEFEVLLAEKKSLSVYISGHPLASAHKFTNNCFLNTSDVRASRLEDDVKVLGIITDIKMKPTEQDMAVFDLEDDKGRVRCVIYHDEFAKYREYLLLYREIYLVVEGRWADSDEEEAYIKVAAIYPFMDAVENYIPSVKTYFQRDAWAMLKKGYPVEDITYMTKLSLDDINKLKHLKSPPRVAD